MTATITPRVIVVTRPTEYEGLLARHATREQVRDFIERRGRLLSEIEARHARQQERRMRLPRGRRRRQQEQGNNPSQFRFFSKNACLSRVCYTCT